MGEGILVIEENGNIVNATISKEESQYARTNIAKNYDNDGNLKEDPVNSQTQESKDNLPTRSTYIQSLYSNEFWQWYDQNDDNEN